MKEKVIAVVVVVMVLIFLANCFSCGGCSGGDGVCDHAGCSKRATTTFGGEMELCLEHYITWSGRARR